VFVDTARDDVARSLPRERAQLGEGVVRVVRDGEHGAADRNERAGASPGWLAIIARVGERDILSFE
jgi:hypothetical protein